MGFVFVTIAAGLKNGAGLLTLVAVLAVLGLLLLLAVFALYGLNVPVALGASPQQGKPALQKAILRTTSFAVLYIALYAWLSWFTWRRVGAARRGVAP
jgi:hypothetical protein